MNHRQLLCVVLAAAVTPAVAHFQELIPTTDIVTAASAQPLQLQLRFTHPMARGPVMDMALPEQFGVVGPAGREDLRASLAVDPSVAQRAYFAPYAVKQPGDYVFFVAPAPYWEPSEGVMIVHYTKVVVSAFGAETGWETEIGLPVEIVPLTRPYGLWTHNLFTGIVKRLGQPVPFAQVEVEWRNDGSVTPPSSPFVTQVIKTDGNGVFSYAMPRAGWWGFAALLAGDAPLPNPSGQAVPVETGAVMWVHAQDMK
ncbi:ATP-dependent DNA ligase [Chromatium okenii]|uniref:DUF4198 domain-containing protein n=1 Tax=Chromatium okenii TaxID=61644 RepID=UPI001907CECB|nr:DUF4198 domain-containing protein [Chromatium okenii]MBK1642899.1 ATP-dependent DNA ligase [Chromatium okenii]